MNSNYLKLAAVSVNDKIEKKGRMDYLSWAWAWHFLKKEFPDANRTVYEDPATGYNYFTDGKTSWVKVGITIGDQEHIDYLPIMDGRNKAIPADAVTSTEVNKTIQRSTAKAIAMHGLGLSLWIGEDTAAMGAPAPKPAGKIDLEVDSDNWGKVLRYIAANKDLGLRKIGENLQVKYNLSAPVKESIKEAYEQ